MPRDPARSNGAEGSNDLPLDARLDVLDEAAAVLMPWEALQTGNEEDCCTIMEETGLEEANPVLWTVFFCERISGSEQTIV